MELLLLFTRARQVPRAPGGPAPRPGRPRPRCHGAPVAMVPPLPWSPRSRGGGGRCGPAPGDVSAAEDGGGGAPVPAACPRSAALRGPSAPRAPAALSAGTAAAPLPAPRSPRRHELLGGRREGEAAVEREEGGERAAARAEPRLPPLRKAEVPSPGGLRGLGPPARPPAARSGR